MDRIRKNKSSLWLVSLMVALSLGLFLACSSDDDAVVVADDTTGDVVDVLAGAGNAEGSRTFEADVLPLFSEAGAFYENSVACTTCHASSDPEAGAANAHALDVSSHAGILIGADDGTADILNRGDECAGEALSDACVASWGGRLKNRLRNTRMPPGWGTGSCGMVEGSDCANRSTAEIKTVEAWVRGEANETQGDGTVVSWDTLLTDLGTDADGAVVVGGANAITWTSSETATAAGATTVGGLFDENDVFYDGGTACTTCHASSDPEAGAANAHALSLATYGGVIIGADDMEADMFGRDDSCAGSAFSVSGCDASAWGSSRLKGRLRNTRMPPGWSTAECGMTEGNDCAGRGTPEIEVIKAWAAAGASATEAF